MFVDQVFALPTTAPVAVAESHVLEGSLLSALIGIGEGQNISSNLHFGDFSHAVALAVWAFKVVVPAGTLGCPHSAPFNRRCIVGRPDRL